MYLEVMMKEVKKIGVVSLAKIGTLFGLLIGIVGYLAMVLAGSLASQAGIQLANVSFSWSGLIYAALAYALIYFLAGILTAVFYNLFASWIGGVKIDIVESKMRKKK